MLELTHETIANARERARGRHPRVSRLSDTEVAVTCQNTQHPGGHVARFERRDDGSLWGECVLRATGELCPAALGRNVCYHLAGAAALFVALEEGEGSGRRPPGGRAWRPADAAGPKRVACAPGTFERCKRLEEAVNATRRSLDMRPVLFVESEAAAP